MNLHLQLARSGAMKALETTFFLAKIIIPVTLVVVALEKLELMPLIADWFNPLVRFFGLPGEAALALLLGFFLNIYSAIGVLIVLPLTGRELTVIAVMILTSHSLLMESPVLKFTGISPWISILFRITAALLFGFLVNLIYGLIGG